MIDTFKPPRTLDTEELLFLRAVDAHGPTFRKGLPPGSPREQDRARQRCKRDGLVRYGDMGWQITAAGKRAVAEVVA